MKPSRRFPQPEPLRLLTVAELAAELAISEQAVYRHVRKGMPVRKFGRTLRFDRAEVDAWSTKDRMPERPTVVLVRGA